MTAPAAPSILLTDREYTDFVLRVEYSFETRATGGVALRGVSGERMPYPDGAFRYEHPLVKLIETSRSKERGATEETGTNFWLLRATDSGWLYVRPTRSAEQLEADSWNVMEIEINGRTMRASVNGKEILHLAATDSRFPDGSLPGLNRPGGRIGLQKHTGIARFRNISIKEIGEGDSE